MYKKTMITTVGSMENAISSLAVVALALSVDKKHVSFNLLSNPMWYTMQLR